MSNYSWTGDVTSITIWGERQAEVGSLRTGDVFQLFGCRWTVERQAKRTTFAREIGAESVAMRIQLKKSKYVCVCVPTVVHRGEEITA